MNEDKFQILSLSGGGIRGLYTISVLAMIEQTLADKNNEPNYNIAKHFDLIGGTSIGGILALGLASGITARDLKGIIDKHRLQIFPQSCLKKIPILGKLFSYLKQSVCSLYKSEPLRKVLMDTFKEKKIEDLNIKVVIPAVNGTTGLPKIYKTAHCPHFDIDRRLSLVEVGMATSAAPTYFNPQLIDDRVMVDGGLIANSPAFIAYHEATHFLGIKKENIHLLSVGTMGVQETLNSDRFLPSTWGYLTGWGMGSKLVALTLSANESMHNFITKQLLNKRFVELDDHNTPNQSDSITLDNANNKAAEMLRGRGKDKGQYALGTESVMAFFDYYPKTETKFYKGGM